MVAAADNHVFADNNIRVKYRPGTYRNSRVNNTIGPDYDPISQPGVLVNYRAGMNLNHFLHLLVIHKHKLDLGLSDYRAAYHRPAPALRRSFSHPDRLGGKHQLVSGNNGLAQLYTIHTQKYSQFTGVLQLLREQ
jgi:hypothetical protein